MAADDTHSTFDERFNVYIEPLSREEQIEQALEEHWEAMLAELKIESDIEIEPLNYDAGETAELTVADWQQMAWEATHFVHNEGYILDDFHSWEAEHDFRDLVQTQFGVSFDELADATKGIRQDAVAYDREFRTHLAEQKEAQKPLIAEYGANQHLPAEESRTLAELTDIKTLMSDTGLSRQQAEALVDNEAFNHHNHDLVAHIAHNVIDLQTSGYSHQEATELATQQVLADLEQTTELSQELSLEPEPASQAEIDALFDKTINAAWEFELAHSPLGD